MKTLFPVYLLLAATALCQSPAYQSPIYPRLRLTDGSDLYQRLMASDYVVIGRVTKLETPDERLSKEEKAKRFGPSFNLSQVKPNSLTTISIDAPLCRNADFLPGAPLVADFPKEAQVFITWGELPALDDVHYIETLVLGEKYLLFLMKDPKQAEIVKRYELNPDVTYYRAVDQNRGTIQLPKETEKEKNGDLVTPFVAAVTSLCQAVRTDSMIGKLQGLGSLRFSVDPTVRDTAETAIRKLTEAEDVGKRIP